MHWFFLKRSYAMSPYGNIPFEVFIMTDQIFRIIDKIFIEAFDDGALVLRLPDRNIFEFNLTALKVLELTDGTRNVLDVSKIFAETFDITTQEALIDINALYDHLQDQKIVERVNCL